jgi:hypothetical protein
MPVQYKLPCPEKVYDISKVNCNSKNVPLAIK